MTEEENDNSEIPVTVIDLLNTTGNYDHILHRIVIKYLDGASLECFSEVCRRWREISLRLRGKVHSGGGECQRGFRRRVHYLNNMVHRRIKRG